MMMLKKSTMRVIGLMTIAAVCGVAVADNTPQTLTFSQQWGSTRMITVDDDWSGVPGFVGYRGDGLTAVTGTDPQTILADGTNTPVDVIANLANTSDSSGGVAEFHIANPVVAVNGSGTADAPFILLNLNTTGIGTFIRLRYTLRDLDGSVDDAVQPIALHYRVGSTGNFTNLPNGFVADATQGPNMAGFETLRNVILPVACNDQPLVQLRFMTTNAVGNDEWVGVDDILVFTCPGDTDDSNGVDINDLLAVINNWGPCVGCPPVHCAADISPIGAPPGDCAIDINDLLEVINNWGPCG